MIKVVIFDADGVLVHGERKFSKTLAEKHGIPLETTLPFFTGPFQKCLTGHADLKEVIPPYLNTWGWSGGLEELLNYWFSLESRVDGEMVQYIQELRKEGVLCLLATNNEKHRFQYMLENMGLGKVFDKVYSSAHLGHKKPDLDFFKKIHQDFKKYKKEEILFVDDDKENVQAAKDFGIHAKFFVSLIDLKDTMEKYRD